MGSPKLLDRKVPSRVYNIARTARGETSSPPVVLRLRVKPPNETLVHEDNQAVVQVLNAMVSASKAMMSEFRELNKLLVALGVQLDARWFPSAVNRLADSLCRTWKPIDVRASDRLLQSIQEP